MDWRRWSGQDSAVSLICPGDNGSAWPWHGCCTMTPHCSSWMSQVPAWTQWGNARFLNCSRNFHMRKSSCLPPIATTPFARPIPSRCWSMALSRRWVPMTSWNTTPARSGPSTWPRARLLLLMFHHPNQGGTRMNATQRPYSSETDLSALLALKQRCTTPQNLYDRPTTSDLRQLFALLAELTTRTSEKPSWQEALRGMSPEHRQRALTQRLTALWEDASGQLVAYALIAQPGSSLTFQVHPQAQEQDIEAEILAWGLAQMQLIARTRGTPRDLWCRCHAVEQGRRSVLETAGFWPLFEPDLRLVHPLATL